MGENTYGVAFSAGGSTKLGPRVAGPIESVAGNLKIALTDDPYLYLNTEADMILCEPFNLRSPRNYVGTKLMGGGSVGLSIDFPLRYSTLSLFTDASAGYHDLVNGIDPKFRAANTTGIEWSKNFHLDIGSVMSIALALTGSVGTPLDETEVEILGDLSVSINYAYVTPLYWDGPAVSWFVGLAAGGGPNNSLSDYDKHYHLNVVLLGGLAITGIF